MPEIPGRLITYCSNIHPGDTWMETFAALQRYVPIVKAAVSPGHTFPIGLRLSSRAAAELTAANNMAFKSWLAEQDCCIATINGFPFGSFHHERIKEQVYLPDWRSKERTEYTIRLARLLANWLPTGINGSISTVPIGFKKFIATNNNPEISKRLQLALTGLRRIAAETGKQIMLALEPEPGCCLETTAEVCRFFDTLDLPAGLMNHLGLCYDCCHQAVEFEEPADSLNCLLAAGIPLAKVQVSSAIRFRGKNPELLRNLDESCYLHQVVVRRHDSELLRYEDLPLALTSHEAQQGDEWRCHFHVPIFHAATEHTGTTQEFLTGLLPLLPKNVLLEVETYTWDVLPVDLRCGTVTDSLIREIRWLKELLHA